MSSALGSWSSTLSRLPRTSCACSRGRRGTWVLISTTRNWASQHHPVCAARRLRAKCSSLVRSAFLGAVRADVARNVEHVWLALRWIDGAQLDVDLVRPAQRHRSTTAGRTTSARQVREDLRRATTVPPSTKSLPSASSREKPVWATKPVTSTTRKSSVAQRHRVRHGVEHVAVALACTRTCCRPSTGSTAKVYAARRAHRVFTCPLRFCSSCFTGGTYM